MDDAQKRKVRDKILTDIAAERINPGCNKRQIEEAINNVAAFRDVASNRQAMDNAIGVAGLPRHMAARVFAAVFAEEEAIEKEVAKGERVRLDGPEL